MSVTISGSGIGGTPTGTATFEVNIGGAGWNTFTGSAVTLNIDGAASTTYTPSSAGSYQFEVVYGGDPNYSSNTSLPSSLTVNQATATVSAATFTPSSPIALGSSVTVSATVTGPVGITPPTGNVQFQVSINGGSYANFGSTAALSGNSASTSYPPQTATTYTFKAEYEGDNNYVSGTTGGSSVTLTVNKATATIGAATFNPSSPIALGSSVTVSASVAGPSGVTAPTGNVQFEVSINGGSYTNFGTPASLSGGSASVQYTPLTPATYNFEAAYQGDSNYVSGTIGGPSGTLTVNKAGASVPAPTLSPSGINDADASVSLSVTVSGNSGTPTGTVTFQVKIGSGSYSSIGSAVTLDSAGSASTTYTLLAAGSYQFQVVYSGDSNYAGLTGSAVSLTVNSALVAPTVSASKSAVDQSQTSILSSTTVTTGTSPYTYQWLEKASGATTFSAISGATSSTYSFATSATTTTGTYSFELQVTDSASTPAIVTSAAVSVTVNGVLTVAALPSALIMDVGQSKTFSAAANGGSGGYTYKWYINNAQVSGQTNSNYTFTAKTASTTPVYAVVTDSVGASVNSNTATITVNASPTVKITPVGPLTLDAGQIQTFTAKATGGSSTIHYQWIEDVTPVGNDSASYSYLAAGSSHVFYCNVTDSASTPFTVASNSVSVKVNSAFGVPTVSASADSVDQSQTATLSSTAVTTGTAPYTYQWLQQTPTDSTFLPISGATSTSYSFVTSASTKTGSWSFELEVNDSISRMVISDPVSITVSSSLNVSIAPVGPLTMAGGQVQIFTATASGGSGSLTYQWYEDITKVGTDNATYSFTASGSSHSITCQVTDSASVPITSTSNAVSITVNSTSSTSTPTPTPKSGSTPTPTPKPKTSPTPTPSENVTATTANGSKVELRITGNITSSQITNVIITTNQSDTTTVSFTLTGVSGTTGFSNITIPKSSVPYGTIPTVYIDGKLAQNQGYSKDANNYHVWYTTHFSSNQVSIQFAVSLASKAKSISPFLAIAITVPGIVLIYIVVAVRRLKRKPDQV
jgi:hypothetical protein